MLDIQSSTIESIDREENAASKEEAFNLLLETIVDGEGEDILSSRQAFSDALECFIKIQRFGETEYSDFRLNAAQKQLLNLYFDLKEAGKSVRIIILKSRRRGMSSMCAAIATLEMLCRANLRCGVAAHVKERVCQYLYMFYEEMIDRFPIGSEFRSKKKLGHGHVLDFNSSYIRVDHEADLVGTALDFFHLSEASRFRDLNAFLTAMGPSMPLVPGTALIVESTAYRYDDGFHQQWRMAERGESNFAPLFLSWFSHESNELEFNKATDERERFTESLSSELDDRFGNERELLENPEVSLKNLKWRRSILRNMPLSDFHREYPSTPEEAFLQTKENVFDVLVLKNHYFDAEVREAMTEGEMEVVKPRHWEKTPNLIVSKPSLIRVYKEPDPKLDSSFYVIGADTSLGRHDYSSAVCLCRDPLEVVAIIRGPRGRNIVIEEFAEQLYHLYRYYNEAYVIPENNDSGLALISLLVQWGCSRLMTHDTIFPETGGEGGREYGWRNTVRTRKKAVEDLRYAVKNRLMRIPSLELVEEMLQFIYVQTGVDGGWKEQAARKGEHLPEGVSEVGFFDDRVFALMGAYLGHNALPPPKSRRELGIERGHSDFQRLYPEREEPEADMDEAFLDYDPRDLIGI